MADAKLTALTEVSVPALDDLTYFVDVSDTTDDAAGSSRKATLTRLLGQLIGICDGRLTLTSGTPITTADVAGATSVYFAPYRGNRVALYDGTRWRLYTFTERTLALGTLTSGLPYDIFLYDNAATLTLELLAWTNGTTRATALTTQDGVLVKTGATTRRYLGTFYTTATTTTEDSASKRLLWNYYNRVRRFLSVSDLTNSWTYGTAAWRQANGSAANQVEYVTGDPATLVEAVATAQSENNTGQTGLGIDSTTAPSGRYGYRYLNNLPISGAYRGYPGLGHHYVAWLERSTGTSVTFYGDDGGLTLSGLDVSLEA